MSVTATTSAPPAPQAARWSPGSLVRARGREWIVLSGSDAEVLRVRPIAGTEEDQTYIHLALETVPVADALFPKPEPSQKSGHDAALLCATPSYCPFAVALARSGALARSPSSHALTNSCHCSWR